MKINTVYRLSELPLIYASSGPKSWHELPAQEGEPAYLLCHPLWQFSWSSLRLYWGLRKMLKRKNIHLILLHNSLEEYRFGKGFGFASYYINQNIHACEGNFVVDPRPKQYDAVYIAAAKPYKRIHLAAEIERLNIITYFWPDVRDTNGDWDLYGFEPRVRHADFNRRRIGADEISQILNSSHCGLALSKREGAMWASMEYLLTGLPIVSTPSVGGRDFFFDDRYVKIVPDKPQDIKKAVEEFKQERLDPEWVRNETLKKIEPVRREYFELCREIGQSAANPLLDDYEQFREHVWGGEGIYKHRIL